MVFSFVILGVSWTIGALSDNVTVALIGAIASVTNTLLVLRFSKHQKTLHEDVAKLLHASRNIKGAQNVFAEIMRDMREMIETRRVEVRDTGTEKVIVAQSPKHKPSPPEDYAIPDSE